MRPFLKTGRYRAKPFYDETAMKPPASAGAEPADDILHQRRHQLDAFFSPKTVAVIGASEIAGTVGRAILWNLVSNPFGGTVFPINPKRASVLGIKAYPKIADVPAKVDLAVVAIPAAGVPAVIGECADAGVKGAVVISAGFRETGTAGIELERQLQAASRGRVRIIGPNCLGVINPLVGLNATFAGAMARPGDVAFISQSGALCTAILGWSIREYVGFSAFVSVGSMLDVGWGDLIEYLGDDPHTQSIVIYMESIGEARSFLSAAREVALAKPIIVVKAGRTETAAKAATSHTGALAGSDEVFDAAFHRSGVLRVNNIADLFHMADVLSKQPRPKGPRLAIVTNAGGPGVLATDALIAAGGELAALSQETVRSLGEFLPAHWSHGNPIDILGDAGPDRYARAVQAVAADPSNDGVLVILAPQGMIDPSQPAEQLKPYARLDGKPILASWMGGEEVAASVALLNRANIPAFSYPDTAARVFTYMWQYSYNLRGLYETPAAAPEGDAQGLYLAREIIQKARVAGRTLLTEYESKRLLVSYGIPVVETRPASSEEEAVAAAADLGCPVAVKLWSETITHKTDVNGVRLNLTDEAAVRRAFREIRASVIQQAGVNHFLGVTVQPMIERDGYELILGSTLDPQFGPVLLFGLGGQLVEVFQDRALALPPLNTTLARRMMEQTRIFTALRGVRGRKPIDLDALEKLLVRFSQFVIEQPRVREVDINPLLVSREGLIALDARVVLHGENIPDDELPRPAIRPYPIQYVTACTLKDGAAVTIRPIRPEDEPLMVHFHETLSERTVYFRYFGSLKLDRRVAHERLARICFTDYDRELVLVAERKEPQTDEHEIIAVARLVKSHRHDNAEFAVLVTDRFQRLGLGTELLHRLIGIARDEKIPRIVGYVMAENIEMQHICTKLGMRLRYDIEDRAVQASLEI